MKDNAADDTVIERLTSALEADTLPKAARDYAQHLLNRLSKPVRVSVLGGDGVGKSQLVNMFLGQSLVPKDTTLPTTEYVWGESEKVTATGADGSVAAVHTSDLSTFAGRNAAFLQVELPIPILRRINLLEVVTEGTVEELSSGVDWAVRRTDIALWCTQGFDEMERSVWNRVPDSLKDHAFLVLTKADLLSAERMLSKRVAELETIVAEEFHSMFAVATLQAIRAFNEQGIDEALFHASGGGALTSEVLRHAERGRRADFDSAHMFLARYQGGHGARSISRRPEVAEATATIAPPVEAPANPLPAVEEVTPPVAPTDQTMEPAPADKVSADVDPALKVQNVELFANAAKYLKRRGDSLAETIVSLGEGETKPVIETCVDAVEHLTDLFSQDETGCEAADAFIDELAEASDIMVLMQVEDGDTPAADAVTLLLQLRRDLEMQLAA